MINSVIRGDGCNMDQILVDILNRNNAAVTKKIYSYKTFEVIGRKQ